MTVLKLPLGDIYVCTRAEARQMWKDEPGKRGQIWLEEEVIAHLFSSADKCDELFSCKMKNPERLLI